MSSHVARDYIVLEIITKVLENPQRRISRPVLWKLLEEHSIQDQYRGAYIGAAKLRKISGSGKGVYYELPEGYTIEDFSKKTVVQDVSNASTPEMKNSNWRMWAVIIGGGIAIAIVVAIVALILVQSAR